MRDVKKNRKMITSESTKLGVGDKMHQGELEKLTPTMEC